MEFPGIMAQSINALLSFTRAHMQPPNETNMIQMRYQTPTSSPRVLLTAQIELGQLGEAPKHWRKSLGTLVTDVIAWHHGEPNVQSIGLQTRAHMQPHVLIRNPRTKRI